MERWFRFCHSFWRVVAVSAGKVGDLGIGCGKGRGSSYFGRFQIISRKKRAVSGALFSSPRAARNMQGFW